MNGKIDAHLKIANLPFQIVYEEEGMLIEEPHWNMECLTEEFIDEDM
ncbi:MAG: hypothetical protein MJ219_02850 [Mycoplasmoidaceae bacterium]|nr:hypothetical protein [Mycoplasmoidaceae bacterium]